MRLIALTCAFALAFTMSVFAENRPWSPITQARDDLAVQLIAELTVWYQRLSDTAIPRVISGVKQDGQQVVVILTGYGLDHHVQRRKFLIWLCRKEQFIAYGYVTHVGRADGSEGLDISASSESFDATRTLNIRRRPEGGVAYSLGHEGVRPAGDNGLFHGLQRGNLSAHEINEISKADEEYFEALWGKISPKSLWRKRSI
jgi:hypothetical protein